MRNIKDYGAVGDGVTLDTNAIQAAIDAGGMVYIPKGTYRTGTLYLKSNGGLHLAHGAVLIGSHERADYNADDFCPQNRVFKEEWATGAHLITAVEQENIVIEGYGVIDGQGDFWMNESKTNEGWPDPENRDYAPNEDRPAQMIFICECKNVRIKDVNIVNGPFWHLFFHGCEDVFVRGLNIRGDRPRWTNDGIDVDCCSRVTISDCMIDVGDDALTIRANNEPLLHNGGRCENIMVTNCILRSARDYGMRIGVGDGVISNCTFSNLNIEAPNICGIGIMSRWSPESKYVTSMERLIFSGCNIKSRIPFDIFVANDDIPLKKPCFIRNISFSNMIMQISESGRLKGTKDIPIENVSFSDTMVEVQENSNFGGAVFNLQDVSDVRFDGLNIISNSYGIKTKKISTNSCQNVTVNGCELY